MFFGKKKTNNVHQVNKTLQGPTSVVLSGVVKDLSGVPKHMIYDHVLNNLEVLRKSFEVLKAERERFADILVDDKGKLVSDNDTPLSCGRTLNEVVAMIVRSATKRHLHQITQGENPLPHLTTEAAANDLYESLNEFLQFDWQVKMVPTYAEMTPPIAKALGPHIIKITDIDQLKLLIEHKKGTKKIKADQGQEKDRVRATAPSPSTAPSDIWALYFSLDGKLLVHDAFIPFFTDPYVLAAVGEYDYSALLKMTGGVSARSLAYGLALQPKQLLVILQVAHKIMGANVYATIMGHPGDAAMVDKIIKLGLEKGINGSSSFKECEAFVHLVYAQAFKKNT